MAQWWQEEVNVLALHLFQGEFITVVTKAIGQRVRGEVEPDAVGRGIVPVEDALEVEAHRVIAIAVKQRPAA